MANAESEDCGRGYKMPDGKPGTLPRIWRAIRQLNPARAVRESEQPFTLALVGTSEEEVAAMRELLLGGAPSQREAARAGKVLEVYLQPLDEMERRRIRKASFILAAEGAEVGFERPGGPGVFTFEPGKPELALSSIVGSRRGAELRMSLARCLPAFRPEVTRRVVREVSRENALFVIATALGNVVPSVFQPLIGAAEAAGDIVFLTANQVRMVFVIGAVYDAGVGYLAQWREIASIVGAAFGWRALARNLVSKIPFGGGLAPKGAVAYAGTAVIGEGLIFFYTTGRRMTREELKEAFKRSYSEAVEAVRSLVGRFRSEAPGSGSGSSPT